MRAEEERKSRKGREQRGNSWAETNASPSPQDRSQTEGWLVFIWVEQDGSTDL